MKDTPPDPPGAPPAAWADALDRAQLAYAGSERAALRLALERVAAAATPAQLAAADPALAVRVLAASEALGRFLARHPDALAELAALRPVRDASAWRESLASAVGDAPDEAILGHRLRLAHKRALLGTVARELVTGDPLATGADLAAFASAAVGLTLEHHARWLERELGAPLLADGAPCTPVVLGVGRLGGGELDPLGELDLIFAYASDQGRVTGGEVDLHTYFSRLFARVGATLATPTDEGVVFTLDLDRRPEGRTGALCNSAAGLERYYESFGHPGERLAWIKARPIAGDLALGERIVRSLAPFVYRRSLDDRFADEVAAMKRRHLARGARLVPKDGLHVVLERGGIREVELVVWTLQLAWGGKLPELRVADTPTALTRLALAGLIEASEADALSSAYRFLRRVEHVLQLEGDRSTQTLPHDRGARQRVAELLGFTAEEGGVAAFEQALTHHRRAVRASFDAIVGGSEKSADPQRDAAFLLIIDAEAAEGARLEAVGELGFHDAAATLRRVDALTRRPASPFHPRALARGGGLARRLIDAVTATPDPDAALAHIDALLSAIRHRGSAAEQLEQDPRRLRTLVSLFGTSQLLSRLLVRSPGLLERLVFDGSASPVHARAEIARLLAAEPGVDGGWEELLGAARRVHQAETLRVGFFDLAGRLDADAVGRQLSDLADAIIEALATRGGDAGDEPLAIVALGRLGARELGYGAPLELIFVREAGADPARAARLARRLVTGLCVATPEGPLYELDARLHPGGGAGPLSADADELRAWYRAEPGVAARVGVLRARVVTGGAAARALVDSLRADALGAYAHAPAEAAGGVRALRERALQAAAGAPDLRSAPGGLGEVELLVALHQLTLRGDARAAARGGHDAGARHVGDALAGLGALGVVDARVASAVVAAYLFLRELEERLVIVQDRPDAGLSAVLVASPAERERHAAELHRFALRMGYGDTPGRSAADELLAHLARHRAIIAEAYDGAVQALSAASEPGRRAP